MIEDVNRRAFLVKLLGIPATLMALENEMFAPEQKTHLMLNDDQMASYGERLETRWEIFHIGGTPRAVRGLDRWMQEVRSFAWTTEATLWHPRALAVLCLSYQQT